MLENYPSKYLEIAVNELSKLPGIGRKTALRLCLFLLDQPQAFTRTLGEALIRLRENIRYCEQCHNISDEAVCRICSDSFRDNSLVCIVESARDVMAIENTAQYRGIYHVLGGIISPFEGKGPSDLTLAPLLAKAESGKIKEVIFALPANMEGDTTCFYLYKKLKPFVDTFTTIARGIAIGEELEYTDELTLGRSIMNRTSYEMPLNNKN
ncbi:MAG TPA: recombination mediator RecR [Bacteroidales bacterium]|nr:recombination mediator RecR [Bacteroidales bacterium]